MKTDEETKQEQILDLINSKRIKEEEAKTNLEKAGIDSQSNNSKFATKLTGAIGAAITAKIALLNSPELTDKAQRILDSHMLMNVVKEVNPTVNFENVAKEVNPNEWGALAQDAEKFNQKENLSLKL